MTAKFMKAYALKLDDNGNIIDETNSPQSQREASRLIDQQAKKYAARHRVSYREALGQVMADPDNRVLVHAYNGPARPAARHDHDSPADQIDKLARAFMQETGEQNYVAAINHVLATEAKLRRAYSACTGA